MSEIDTKTKLKRKWVRKIFTEEQRESQGFTKNLLEFCEIYEPDMFQKYLHVTPSIFYKLLELIQADIQKKDTIMRSCISPKTRLQILLRYLATGNSMLSLSAEFRVAHNTISLIISDTCAAIWKRLSEKVFLKPSQENWLKEAKEFEKIWNFPHCIGACDGRHMVMQVIIFYKLDITIKYI